MAGICRRRDDAGWPGSGSRRPGTRKALSLGSLAALRPCFLLMLGMSLRCLLLPHLLLSVFVAETSVVQAGTVALRCSLLTLPAMAISFICNGSLRGADTDFRVERPHAPLGLFRQERVE